MLVTGKQYLRHRRVRDSNDTFWGDIYKHVSYIWYIDRNRVMCDALE